MRLYQILTQAVLISSSLAWGANKQKDAVKLSSVRTLTLRDGQLTSHRRVDPIPQLKCVGGNAKGLYDVDVMRCTNAGSEYGAEDIQWTCKASLPPEFKLGSTEVICEGFDSPDDPYVLKGSCGVEYRLILTPLGEEKYGVPRSSWKGTQRVKPSEYDEWKANSGSGMFTFLFWIVFLGVAGLIVYSVIFGPPFGDGARQPRRRMPFGGFGWGGGYDDNNDPPPPYSRRPPPNTRSSKSSWGTFGSSSNQQPYQPGFWTGTAAGAAAGWAANAFANRNRNQYDAPVAGPSNYRQARAQPSGSWFGGGESSSPPSGSSFGSRPAPSSSRHESTGFGGTRRR